MKWEMVRLGDVFFQIKNGASIKQTAGLSGIPITRIETISNSFLDYEKLGYADISDDSFQDFYLENGDILMSHINSWTHLGKNAIVENINHKIIHGMNLLLLRGNKDLLFPKYSKYYFDSEDFKLQLNKISNQSVNQSSFSVTKLKDLQIPLPPLAIQKRIAEVLDAADALRRKDQQLLQKYDELAQAVFVDMFGDPVRNEKGWEVKRLGEVGKITTGNTPSRMELENYNHKYVEWIKTDNIEERTFFVSKASEYLSEVGAKKGRIVPVGSLLVTCIAGSIDSIGRAALTNREVSFNQQINAIEPNENTNSFFLYFLFKHFRKYIQSHASNGMKRMISKGEFEKIKIILPDLNIQQEFERKIRLLIVLKEKMEDVFLNSDTLFQTLLHQAFKGELITP